MREHCGAIFRARGLGGELFWRTICSILARRDPQKHRHEAIVGGVEARMVAVRMIPARPVPRLVSEDLPGVGVGPRDPEHILNAVFEMVENCIRAGGHNDVVHPIAWPRVPQGPSPLPTVAHRRLQHRVGQLGEVRSLVCGCELRDRPQILGPSSRCTVGGRGGGGINMCSSRQQAGFHTRPEGGPRREAPQKKCRDWKNIARGGGILVQNGDGVGSAGGRFEAGFGGRGASIDADVIRRLTMRLESMLRNGFAVGGPVGCVDGGGSSSILGARQACREEREGVLGERLGGAVDAHLRHESVGDQVLLNQGLHARVPHLPSAAGILAVLVRQRSDPKHTTRPQQPCKV
mmetsp:Transcript_159587/g.508066  ORF Transcript_159587/g.508066 Transcript_159587/m.508066 type:complete len:348 (-) Transcript_159587:1290-2333(-)